MLLRKSVFEYNMKSFLWGMMWFFLVYVGLFILAVISSVWSSGAVQFNVGTVTTYGGSSFGGAEVMFFIAFMIACMADFTAEFHFMYQHGISRRSHFANTVLFIVVGGAALTAILHLSTALFTLIGNAVQLQTVTIFSMVYGTWLGTVGTLGGVLMNLLFSWTMLLAAGVLGFFIAVLFYNLGKLGKTIFWAVIIGSSIFMPILNNLTGGRIGQAAIWFGQTFIGRGDVPNPLNGIGVFLVLAIIGLIPCWLLIRRVKLKKV